MASKALFQPAWVNDLSLLQKSILSIIGEIVDLDHISVLLDEKAMLDYWVPAFTHSSVDVTNNYERLEFYGDKVLNYAFASYIRKRFDNELNQKEGTLLLNQYMSKKFQAGLARNLKLVELVRYDPEVPDVNISIQEDIFESFFGALSTLVDDRIQPGLGYIYSFNLISSIFNEISISQAEIQQDPVTQLKELLEKLGWDATYVETSSDDPERGDLKIEIRMVNGDVIGVGYGSKKSASSKAAQNALNRLAQQGITAEYAEQEKLRRTRIQNPELDHQYRRLERAIEILKAQAASQGRARIDRFRVTRKGAPQKVRGGFRYTWSIDIAYDTGERRLIWRSVQALTGSNAIQTKIDLMKSFADKYVPPNL